MVAAGYCSIANKGASAVTIIGFEAQDGAARRVELHETTTSEGVARMRPLDRLTVAAGETAALQPGGMHLMLFDLAPGVRSVEVAAVLADGDRVPVTFRVRAPAP